MLPHKRKRNDKRISEIYRQAIIFPARHFLAILFSSTRRSAWTIDYHFTSLLFCGLLLLLYSRVRNNYWASAPSFVKMGGGVAKLTHLPFVVYLIILSSCKRETLVFACSSMACTCMYFVSVELGIFVGEKCMSARLDSFCFLSRYLWELLILVRAINYQCLAL